MAQQTMSFTRQNPGLLQNLAGFIWDKRNRALLVAILLALALFAFEIFNYDTTQFALQNLLGDISFFNLTWASILAFAFCAIDFAGLVKIFTPQTGPNEPKEVWYLMGAWLLGATMNAVMTWYAVSILLTQRPPQTEVLSQGELLTFAPIFVAVLVWLTRILFIGSLSVAGEQLIAATGNGRYAAEENDGVVPSSRASGPPSKRAAANQGRQLPRRELTQPVGQPTSRIRRRPPMAGGFPNSRLAGMRAQKR